MDVHVDFRIVDYPLENLTVLLEECCPDRIGFSHRTLQRPLEGVAIHCALDSHQHADLPVRTSLTRLLGQPDVQLRTRQWQGAVA